ncbi:MAG: calcium-binding protein [Symploca sp. SIO3C6]|nr:calcium-binding protein [Symploca sp. SIO3C6]NET05389.1 calcium-binding protein [Symploca sp. SIO2B6]NET53810.1 calcium-binding protein [Merismopedia sp. SIO2A8]
MENPEGTEGDDLLEGTESNDTLIGGNGDDQLFGQNSNDILVGASGNDILVGGLGEDIFHFNYLADGIDLITDFEWSEGDKIQIYQSGFGASSTDNFSYNSDTGELSFLGTHFATLDNKPKLFLTSIDIELVSTLLP